MWSNSGCKLKIGPTGTADRGCGMREGNES